MTGLLNLLTVGSRFVIGYVLINGLGGAYEIYSFSLTGWRGLLTGLAVLGGSTAARFIRSETADQDDQSVIEACLSPRNDRCDFIPLRSGRTSPYCCYLGDTR